MGEDALRLIALILAATSTVGCQQEPPQRLRVHEAIKNIHSLNGQTVRVIGYLGECGGYDCGLYQDKADWQQAQLFFAAARKTHKSPALELPDWLGISAGELICNNPLARNDCYSEVDKKAAPFRNSYVMITGKLNDSCRDEQLRPGCTDRAPELEPTTVTHWAPAKTKS